MGMAMNSKRSTTLIRALVLFMLMEVPVQAHGLLVMETFDKSHVRGFIKLEGHFNLLQELKTE